MHAHELSEATRIRNHHSDLCRAERSCLADLLVSVGDFEHRGLHRVLGYASIFDYLHRALVMSKGMAHCRMVGARLIRRFPEVEQPVRDGRLCLTTVIEVARVMTEENRAEVLPRFFGLSRQEAKEVAAELDPAKVVPKRTVVSAVPRLRVLEQSTRPDPKAGKSLPVPEAVGGGEAGSTVELDLTHPEGGIVAASSVRHAAVRERTTVAPLTATESRLHVTVSREFLALLKKAKAGESHRNPGATDEEVLKLALEALIEKQSKRKASVPARVKREVVARDEGKCQWRLPDGTICGATARLEIDHVVPRGMGGPSTVDNCRILCKGHNLEAARQAYGDEVMDLFTRPGVAREPAVEYLPGAPPLAAGTTVPPRRVTARIETRFTDRVGFPAGRWRGREAAPRTGRSGRRGACRGARDGLAPPPGTGPVAA